MWPRSIASVADLVPFGEERRASASRLFAPVAEIRGRERRRRPWWWARANWVFEPSCFRCGREARRLRGPGCSYSRWRLPWPAARAARHENRGRWCRLRLPRTCDSLLGIVAALREIVLHRVIDLSWVQVIGLSVFLLTLGVILRFGDLRSCDERLADYQNERSDGKPTVVEAGGA